MKNVLHALILLFSAPALLCLSVPSNAQAYKCMIDGKTVYQGTPCDGGKRLDLPAPTRPEAPPQTSTYLEREAARLRVKDAIETAIYERRILVGMSSDNVVDSWGQPTRVSRIVDAGGSSEQWVYRRPGVGNNQYVNITNGKVTSIQSGQ